MKFAKHVAKAMTFSDPEWLPFWINYRFLKKLLPHKVVSSAPAGPVATAAPKSAPAPSAAVARSAPALDHYDHVRDAAGMSTGNPTGSADRRWQPRKQKDGIIQSTSLRTMGAATSTTAATSTASAAAAKSRASWGVSQGLRPCPQQPRPQRGCTRLPSRRHASSSSARVATQEGERRDCVVEGGGRDDVGGGRGNVQKEELAAANANRRAFAINSRTCGRPTCCSRLSSGCGAAAIPAAAALGLCSPATAASAGVLRPKHQLHHQRQQNQRLNHHPPRQAPQQQQREAGGGEGERRGEGRGGHWKAAPALQCPFFLELLREIYKCRVFFLQNEDELKVSRSMTHCTAPHTCPRARRVMITNVSCPRVPYYSIFSSIYCINSNNKEYNGVSTWYRKPDCGGIAIIKNAFAIDRSPLSTERLTESSLSLGYVRLVKLLITIDDPENK